MPSFNRRQELTPALQQLLKKHTMEATKRCVLQLIASSTEEGVSDQQVSNELKISLDEARFHLDDLDRTGFIKLIRTSTYLEGEVFHALSVTPRGTMVLKGKISFEDGLTSSSNSQTFKITNHGSVANQQFGNSNTANVTQNVGSNTAEILQMLHALRLDVSSLPPESQTIAIEALADIEEEVITPTRTSRIRGGLLSLWSVVKDVVTLANAATSLAQRFEMDKLLS